MTSQTKAKKILTVRQELFGISEKKLRQHTLFNGDYLLATCARIDWNTSLLEIKASETNLI